MEYYEYPYYYDNKEEGTPIPPTEISAPEGDTVEKVTSGCVSLCILVLCVTPSHPIRHVNCQLEAAQPGARGLILVFSKIIFITSQFITFLQRAEIVLKLFRLSKETWSKTSRCIGSLFSNLLTVLL